MKAVVCKAINEITVEDVTLDPPQAGEVRIKMAATGVCHSDLSVINGTLPLPLPLVLGHEGAGVVQAVGEGVTHVAAGDHVIMTFVPNCGECFHCVRGEAYLCRSLPGNGRQRDGTARLHLGDQDLGAFLCLGNMAEEVVCPDINVVPVSKDVSLKTAALIGCGVTTGVGAAFNTAGVQAGDSVAVFGCGGVGLSVIQGARIAGASRIIAVDLMDNKLEMAVKFGATDTVNGGSGDPVARIKELTGGIGVDMAFEAIGAASVVQQAFMAARAGGKCIVVGMASPMEQLTLSPFFLTYENKSICGCYAGTANPRVDIPRLLELAACGKLDLEGMVTSTYTIDEAPKAFEDMEKGVNARGVIVYD